MHIDTVLKEIAKTVLISLPESGATRVEDMLTLNEVCIDVFYFNHKNTCFNHKPKMYSYSLKVEVCVSCI